QAAQRAARSRGPSGPVTNSPGAIGRGSSTVATLRTGAHPVKARGDEPRAPDGPAPAADRQPSGLLRGEDLSPDLAPRVLCRVEVDVKLSLGESFLEGLQGGRMGRDAVVLRRPALRQADQHGCPLTRNRRTMDV